MQEGLFFDLVHLRRHRKLRVASMALLQVGNAEGVQPSSVAITEGTHVEQLRTEVHRTDQNTDASG